MNQIHAILRDTMLCLLPSVGVGWWLGGVWGLFGTIVTGLVVVFNLFAIGRLVPRVTAYLAGTDPAGVLAVSLLAVKFPLMLVVVTYLLTVFGGVPIALGMGSLVAAVFVRGVALMLRPPPEPEPVAPLGS